MCQFQMSLWLPLQPLLLVLVLLLMLLLQLMLSVVATQKLCEGNDMGRGGGRGDG